MGAYTQCRLTTDKLTRALTHPGTSVEEISSSLSESYYLMVTRWTADGEFDQTIKIRISDHELPPTYANQHGSADYEIGDNNGYSSFDHETWHELAIAALTKLGVSIPAYLKALKTKDDAKKRAMVEADERRQQDFKSALIQTIEDARPVYEQYKDAMNNWFEKIEAVSGQKRRQLRGKFKDRFGISYSIIQSIIKAER